MSQEDNRNRRTEGIDDVDAGTSQAQRDARISSDEGDYLSMTPPDMMPRAGEALMAGEEDEQETIDQRIAQEEPDPNSAYGAPDDEGDWDTLEEADPNAARGERVGGDDPDSIPAERDVLGAPEEDYLDDSAYGTWRPGYGDGTEPAEQAAMSVEPDSMLDGDAPEEDFAVDDGLDTEDDIDELVEDDS